MLNIDLQMYQNTLMQQQYMQSFLPGGMFFFFNYFLSLCVRKQIERIIIHFQGKLGSDKPEGKDTDMEKGEEKTNEDNTTEMKEDLPPLPPGSPPKTPPPPEISSSPKISK